MKFHVRDSSVSLKSVISNTSYYLYAKKKKKRTTETLLHY